MSAEPSEDGPAPPSRDGSDVTLHSRGYLSILLLAGLIGAPISAIAFGFLAVVHELEHIVWHDLPEQLGLGQDPPPWWPAPALILAALLVACAVQRLPGHGGHVPAHGMGGGPTLPRELPGVLLAASASLVLGAVVGPEAPLIALGGALGYAAVSRADAGDQVVAIVSAAGSAAAISAVFGNPLIAAVMILEVAGLARRQALLLTLPCLVSSGIGALVFTGLGDWTGFAIGELSIPDLEPSTLDLVDLLVAVPLGMVVGAVMWAVFVVGRLAAAKAAVDVWRVTIGAAVITAGSAALYAVVTDHPPTEITGSGQAMLASLATQPDGWTSGALALLVVCKAAAYAISIGTFRGGPVFPAVFLGAAIGILTSMWVPGVDSLPALAIGIAAGASVIGLPITALVLAALLVGDAAAELMPVMILAAVAAIVVSELLTSLAPSRPDAVRP